MNDSTKALGEAELGIIRKDIEALLLQENAVALAEFDAEIQAEIIRVTGTEITNTLAYLYKLYQVPSTRKLLRDLLSAVLAGES